MSAPPEKRRLPGLPPLRRSVSTCSGLSRMYHASTTRAALTLLLLLSCGCVRTAVVKFWEPAEIDVSRMHRVTVLEFQGEHGQAVASQLSSRLWENHFYTVIDPLELSGQVQMAGFERGAAPDLGGVLDQARSSKIDGVLVGEVVRCRCDDEFAGGRWLVFRRDHESSESPENPKGRRQDMIRRAEVEIAFRLVDVATGEIRASRNVHHSFEQQYDSGRESPPAPEEILNELTAKCVADIVAMLAPHEKTSRIELALGDVWLGGRKEMKAGIEHAARGEWEAAEEQWRAALEVDPENHAAYFNLAVAADQRQLYDAAEEFAMQALRLQHRTAYAQGLRTIRDHRAAHEKFQDQRDAQVLTAADTDWRS